MSSLRVLVHLVLSSGFASEPGVFESTPLINCRIGRKNKVTQKRMLRTKTLNLSGNRRLLSFHDLRPIDNQQTDVDR
jgi:hypothetical protein